MTKEHIEALQDAWFMMRDVYDETKHKGVHTVMKALHSIIDAEIEKGDYDEFSDSVEE